MLVIRMARVGRTKYPVYRIVAAESARAATGRFIEVLGHYNPHTKDLNLKKDEIMQRLAHGAQPSNTVIKLLQREEMELPKWVKLKTKTPKAIAEAPSEDTAAETEAPTEEPQVNEPDAGEDEIISQESPATQTQPKASNAEELAAEPTETQTENDERVATAATGNAADIEGETTESANGTETVATEDAAIAAREKTEKAGDVAVEEATKSKDE